MSNLTPERIEALRRSAQRGHYADCAHAADEPVCACWAEYADGLAETLAALTAAAEREQGLREKLQDADGCSCAYCPEHAQVVIDVLKFNLESVGCVMCLALAAERLKVQALRDRWTRRKAKICEKLAALPEHSPYLQGLAEAHQDVLNDLDVLGLPSPDAPQPTQEKP